MDKVYLHPEIYYIKNILSEQDLNTLIRYCTDEENWITLDGAEKETIYRNNYNQVSNPYILNIVDNLNSTISQIVDTENIRLNQTATLARFRGDSRPQPREGTFWDDEYWSMNPHRDKSCQHSEIAVNCCHAAAITQGVVFYINDDYLGGEIEYVDYDIIYKPVANSLLIHNADILHGVKRVIQGDRYTFPLFAHDISMEIVVD